MSNRRHTLHLTVHDRAGNVVRLTIDTSQRRRAWWHVMIDELRPGSTVRASGDHCELIDARAGKAPT